MGISVHTNFSSMVAQNNLNKTNSMLGGAMERLGTGYRINSAADDAAGLQIANRLNAQTRGMNVAVSNSQDAINMLNTGDSALDEVGSIALRMKDLATQSANDTNSAADRSAMNEEYQELKSEVTRILTDTTYGGDALLQGGKLGTGPVVFQIGASAAETLSFDASAEVTALDPAAALVTADISTQANASAAITELETYVDSVGTARSKLGATVNRLDHTINNLESVSQNTQAAYGRIMDADFAAESSNMTKQQMLMQSGISVLAKSNQMTGMVSSLLR